MLLQYAAAATAALPCTHKDLALQSMVLWLVAFVVA
jgi:hypothetical protein